MRSDFFSNRLYTALSFIVFVYISLCNTAAAVLTDSPEKNANSPSDCSLYLYYCLPV